MRKKSIKFLSGTVVLAVIFLIVGIVVSNRTQAPGVDEERVIEMVRSLPEVSAFERAVEDNGRSEFAITAGSREEEKYLIRVYEVFPDHSVTFGWYRYTVADDTVKKEDLIPARE